MELMERMKVEIDVEGGYPSEMLSAREIKLRAEIMLVGLERKNK